MIGRWLGRRSARERELLDRLVAYVECVGAMRQIAAGRHGGIVAAEAVREPLRRLDAQLGVAPVPPPPPAEEADDIDREIARRGAEFEARGGLR